MQKPDGLIGLLPSQLPRAIAHLELRDLPGVGARTEMRLNRQRHHTPWSSSSPSTAPACTISGTPSGATASSTGFAAHVTGDDGAPCTLRAPEIPRPLPRPRPRAPLPRRRLGRRPQAPPQGRHAPPHGTFSTPPPSSVTIKFSLTREQVAGAPSRRRRPAPVKRQHSSGIHPNRLGHGSPLPRQRRTPSRSSMFSASRLGPAARTGP